MEKQENFCKRQAQKLCRLFPVAILLFLFLSVPLKGYSNETFSLEGVQQNTIKVIGTVKDTNGEPIIGANVMVVGSATGVITDIDGNFVLNAPAGSKLQFSFIGYKEQVVPVKKGISLKIVLEEDSQMLGEVEVVAYGVQKKVSVTGAISSMKGDDLLKTPAGSISNILSGQVTGVSSVQYSGEPGADAADIYVRGIATFTGSSSPLIQVDGVEREMSQIDPNEIESITVLKDASATAVFGVRGANGVILITTKRGEEGKAVININASTTLKTYSKLPDMMDAYDALSLRNQVIENELAYHPDSWSYYLTQDRLYKYRHPANLAEAERYPNINWVDYLLKDVATSYNANVNISGGTKFVKYFASADFAHEGDIYKKVTNVKGYDPGFSYDRINVRSNLDFNLTKTTKLHLNLSGSHAVKKATQGQYENLVWSAFYGIAPDSFMPVYSDGTFGYYKPNETQAATNSYEDLSVNGIGYTTDDRLNTDFTLEQDLGFLLKGLNVQAKLAFDNAFRETGRGVDDTTDWEKEAHKWIDPETGKEYTNTSTDALYKFDFKNNNAWKTGAGSVNNGETYRRMDYSVQLNYSNKFGDHTVGAMGNFSREQYAKGSEQPFRRENWVFRATYDYASRYMVEYNGAYNGSDLYSSENRFAFFNSGAVGWMVSEEPLVKKLNLKWLDMLKLRASYGQIGQDGLRIGNYDYRFGYMDVWSNGGNYRQSLTGVDPAKSPYTWWQQSQMGNPELQWEVATKLDIAADFAFFGGVISGSFDYFKEKRTDILIPGTQRAIPSYFGTEAPIANLGKVDSKGYELEIRWNKQLTRSWRLWGNASLTHAVSEIKEANDPSLMPEYQKKANKGINQNYSYVDKGYYNSWDELYGSTAHDEYDENRKPGNYIILDYDADGVITQDDNIPYGYTGIPQNTMNLQIGFDYKGWSCFVQFYGVNNVSRSVGLTSLGGTRNTAFFEGSYWSPDNQNADVPLPRWLNQASKYTDGTRFLFDGSYTRLKYAELSYTFSKEKWLKASGLSSLKLFVNGNNLFLWTDMPDDRESNTGGWSAYPTQRRFNLGFKITL